MGIRNKNIIKCFEKHKNYRISNSIVGYIAIITLYIKCCLVHRYVDCNFWVDFVRKITYCNCAHGGTCGGFRNIFANPNSQNPNLTSFKSLYVHMKKKKQGIVDIEKFKSVVKTKGIVNFSRFRMRKSCSEYRQLSTRRYTTDQLKEKSTMRVYCVA